MATFHIDVTRIGYAKATLSIEASTLGEAQELALDQAGNHLYNEHDAEYMLSDRITPQEAKIQALENELSEIKARLTQMVEMF